MSINKTVILLFLFFLLSGEVLSAVVSGYVRNQEGEFLPFATIYIKELDYGTTTNMDGYYEFQIPEGSYTMIVQYLGYETYSRSIDISNKNQIINIRLKDRSLVLPNLTYRAGEEDPAYAIMRRVIAKSKYHLYQLSSYKTRVYVKGSGRLLKAPFFVRKQLQKEGIDSTRVFMVESISDVEYEMPDKYSEKVISINSTIEEETPGPMPFIKASFYQPRIEDALSPISPIAFNHYRFSYEGSFTDKGVTVNKIYVKPRIRGDVVFEGYLYIIEDLWAIHSLDFTTYVQGFEVNIKQIYHPIQSKVWLPVTHRFDVSGSYFGFKFEFKYVAINNEYDIVLNEQLIHDTPVEKTEGTGITEISREPDPSEDKIRQMMNEEKKMSKKEMKKIMKEYEKQALEEEEEDDVVYTENISIDSAAYKRDSIYWEKIRPVPLSSLEKTGIEIRDSLIVVRNEKDDEDSLREEKNKGFRLIHIISGNNYKLSDKTTFAWRSVWDKISFNTVEGWNLNAGFDFIRNIDSTKTITVGPTIRYGFASHRWNGKIDLDYRFRKHYREGYVNLSAGRYISQINPETPIPFWLNMFSSLLFRENFMKLLEKDYISLEWYQPVSPELEFHLFSAYQENKPLFNTTDFSLFDQNKEYMPNQPQNVLLNDTGFEPYYKLTSGLGFNYYPGTKYIMRNGVKSIIPNSSPVISLQYAYINDPGNNTPLSYHKLSASFRMGRKFGVGNRYDLFLSAGKFFSENPVPFPEFIHFMGNQTPLITNNLFTSYRMLNYYLYSTDDYFLQSHLFYQFRQLLLTQIIYLRMAGIREDLFVKYLHANTLDHYTEFGYALDQIYGLFRVEIVGQFEKLNYRGIGFRIGVSKNIAIE